jgi:hypothetical protein
LTGGIIGLAIPLGILAIDLAFAAARAFVTTHRRPPPVMDFTKSWSGNDKDAILWRQSRHWTAEGAHG